ncbi:G gene product [Kotonkan virus]|uniref:Virion transmembrane glycoprotein n=1 Tax=Kotonkan virus TaxID=318836 RepID=H8XWF3_9RHAB|nr:G gene product [Kotonkan virus]AEI17633.1 virion transmembrane glycoprotein [Kotonkan virus]
MKSLYYSLFLLFNAKNIITYRIANLPFNCENEHSIPVEAIDCPVRRNELKVENLKQGGEHRVCKPKLSTDDHVQGKLCRIQQWKTKCTETWYFTTYIEYEVVDVMPNKIECAKEWERTKAGFPIIPFFPPAVCYWNAENVISETFVTLVDHPVLQDPYNSEVIDPIFYGTRCSPINSFDSHWFCKSVNNLIMWMSDKDQLRSPHCDIKTWDCIVVKAYVAWDEDHNTHNYLRNTKVWESPDIGRVGLYDACKKRFCGVDGIRLNNGEWWFLEREENYYGFDYRGMRNCRAEETIGVRTHVDRTLFEEIDIKLEIEHSKCIDVLIKLRSGITISPFELGYLAPSSYGKGYAYRFEQETKNIYQCFPKIEKVPQIKYITDDLKNCKDNKTRYARTITQTKIGNYKRALCNYKNVFIPETKQDQQAGYDIKMWTFAGTNDSIKEHIENNSWSPFKSQSGNNYTIGWNGMIKLNTGRYLINTYALLDGLIHEAQLSALEVKSFQHPVYQNFDDFAKWLNGSSIYEERELLDDSHLERTDVIKSAGEKIKGIYHNIVGWFSGVTSIVRWILWGVGAIVTVYVILKIRRVIKNKHDEKDNKSEIKQFFERLGKIKTHKGDNNSVPNIKGKRDKKEDEYEMINFYS